MKKIICYLSITCLLAAPNTIATEVTTQAYAELYPLVELLQTFRAENESLRDQLEVQELKIAMDQSLEKREKEELEQALAHMCGEMGKEQASKEALQKLVNIIKQEQRESKQLLQHVLEELIPPYTPPLEESPSEEDILSLQAALLLSLEKTNAVVPNDTVQNPKEDDEEAGTLKKDAMRKEIEAVKGTPKRKELEKPNEKISFNGAAKSVLPPYQQTLNFQRHLIGDNAWAALDGTNPNLSAKLCEAIQGWPGKQIDISNQNLRSFTLRVNGKGQDKVHKF